MCDFLVEIAIYQKPTSNFGHWNSDQLQLAATECPQIMLKSEKKHVPNIG
jgi:hypothetical protein